MYIVEGTLTYKEADDNRMEENKNNISLNEMQDKLAEELTRQYSLPREWKINKDGASALVAASVMQQNQYARYVSVPVVCKGQECPYLLTCGIAAIGMDVDTLVGQRCPIEIQFIVEKFEKYIGELDIDQTAEVDLSLVKELVDLDVMLKRADNKMAQEVDFTEDVAVSINNRGEVIRRNELRKSVEFKERMMKKRHEILELLNSTRKDKAGNKIQMSMDPSSYATLLLAKAMGSSIGDGSFEVTEEDGEDDE